jgi:diacylglycerol kinase (ATP)
LVHLIANPASGQGRGARALPAARRALEAIGEVAVHTTRAAGDEGRCVDDALDAGATTIAVLGGDGTWSKTACPVLAGAADVRIALLAAGTGNDLAKSVGAPAGDYPATARLIAADAERRIDAGRVDDAFFVNIAGFGFDAAVVAQMLEMRWVSGPAAYAYAALRQLFGYRGFTASALGTGARTDAGPSPYLGIFFANGRSFGGAFTIAPRAAIDDGLLDVITLGPIGTARRVAIFAAALRGTHIAAPEVAEMRAARHRWRFAAPPIFEADGELRRARSETIDVTCVPAALRVVAPPNAASAASSLSP